MAQLVERSPPTPEARLSNPVIGQKITLNVYCQLPSILTKIKKKEAGNGPFFLIEVPILFHLPTYYITYSNNNYKECIFMYRLK